MIVIRVYMPKGMKEVCSMIYSFSPWKTQLHDLGHGLSPSFLHTTQERVEEKGLAVFAFIIAAARASNGQSDSMYSTSQCPP